MPEPLSSCGCYLYVYLCLVCSTFLNISLIKVDFGEFFDCPRLEVRAILILPSTTIDFKLAYLKVSHAFCDTRSVVFLTVKSSIGNWSATFNLGLRNQYKKARNIFFWNCFLSRLILEVVCSRLLSRLARFIAFNCFAFRLSLCLYIQDVPS